MWRGAHEHGCRGGKGGWLLVRTRRHELCECVRARVRALLRERI